MPLSIQPVAPDGDGHDYLRLPGHLPGPRATGDVGLLVVNSGGDRGWADAAAIAVVLADLGRRTASPSKRMQE